MNITHVRRLHEHVESRLPMPDGALGYHPDAIESALLDTAFSARALYGSPTTGVRAVLARWGEHRGVEHSGVDLLDDLEHLAMFAEDPEHLVAVLGNRQRVPGNHVTKAEAVALAARSLSSHGCTRAADLSGAEPDCVEACRSAFVAIPGFGRRTWENFAVRLGLLTTDATDVLDEFLAELFRADEVDDYPDRDALVAATAHQLDITPGMLIYRMWKSRRERQRDLARVARAARAS